MILYILYTLVRLSISRTLAVLHRWPPLINLSQNFDPTLPFIYYASLPHFWKSIVIDWFHIYTAHKTYKSRFCLYFPLILSKHWVRIKFVCSRFVVFLDTPTVYQNHITWLVINFNIGLGHIWIKLYMCWLLRIIESGWDVRQHDLHSPNPALVLFCPGEDLHLFCLGYTGILFE